jgi:uncharacterized protein (TIGR00375 family)
MQSFVADLHVHIGRTLGERAVKVTAARDLTFANIAKECVVRKGVDLVGIVDCAAPRVIAEIEQLLAAGEMVELPGGGLRYQEKVTVILASELETAERNGAASHHISYFATLEQLRDFSKRIASLVSNLELSSQRCRVPAGKLFELTEAAGGLFVPAHAFTPFKSPYGSCVRRLGEMFSERALGRIPAIELGLSADTDLADQIAELAEFSFLSNSDAHSLPKIAREYNLLLLEEATFAELELALRGEGGRRILANYGLDPRLGKYHRTYCPECKQIERGPPPALRCSRCGGERVVKGVRDRVVEIQDYAEPRHPETRPPYRYQVPLQFLPGIGAVALGKLLNRFGTEMAVLHQASRTEIESVVGTKLAERVILAREGRLQLLAGGGGRYGKAVEDQAETQLSMGL